MLSHSSRGRVLDNRMSEKDKSFEALVPLDIDNDLVFKHSTTAKEHLCFVSNIVSDIVECMSKEKLLPASLEVRRCFFTLKNSAQLFPVLCICASFDVSKDSCDPHLVYLSWNN